MRYCVFFFFLLLVFTSVAQIVDIPDANFKNALINTLCVASGFQDVPAWDADVNNDGEIQVSEAEAIVHLVISGQNIDSLEGIEAFIGLKSLRCVFNNITELDLSNSPDLENLNCSQNLISSLNISQSPNLGYINCTSNDLSELDVTQNINLVELICYNNSIQNLDLSQNGNLDFLHAGENELNGLNISQNINLTGCYIENNNISEIDLSQNILLRGLGISNNNLNSLDTSNNPDLKYLICYSNPIEGELDLSHLNGGMYVLMCNNTLLSSLNIKNGDNINLTRMWAQDNLNLTCIEVDDVSFANSQSCQSSSGWCKDETAVYSEDCNLGTEEMLHSQFVIYPNPAKDVLLIYNESISEVTFIKIYDTLGRLVLEQSNPSNQVDVSNLSSGLLFLQITTDNGSLVKKVIKE
jgi:hypothetical protein